MGRQTLCTQTKQVADQLVAHGREVGANTVSHAVATLMMARSQGISLDEVVEGLLDIDRLLEHPEAIEQPPRRPRRRALVGQVA